jgi:hypothetical protein
MAFDLSTKAVQQIEELYNKSTVNPQQIEQVEYELETFEIGKVVLIPFRYECYRYISDEYSVVSEQGQFYINNQDVSCI